MLVPPSEPSLSPAGKPIEVFLSHATADNIPVTLVKEQIEALGANVYIAEHDLKPGVAIAEKIEDAIKKCSFVVVLLTSLGSESGFVHQEIGMAKAYQKIIIPIVEKVIDTTKLGFLDGIEWIEFDRNKPAELTTKLTQSLQPSIVAQISAYKETASGSSIQASVGLSIQLSEQDLQRILMVVGGIVLLFVACKIISNTPNLGSPIV